LLLFVVETFVAVVFLQKRKKAVLEQKGTQKVNFGLKEKCRYFVWKP